MKWPWVSRAMANSRIVELQTLLKGVEALRQDERRHNIGTAAQHADTVDRLSAQHADAIADLRRRLDESEADRRKLTRTVVKMKVAGGSIPRVLAGQRLEQRERDPIEKAIDENPRCRSNASLRRQQLRWATDQRVKGVPEDEIIDRLSNWHIVVEHDDDEDDADDRIAV